MVRPVRVAPQPGFKLHLEYEDGTKGEVDVSHLVGKGVFAPLTDTAVFEAVTIGDHGEIRWSDEMELCADAFYLQLTGKSAEQLFPNLKTHVDA